MDVPQFFIKQEVDTVALASELAIEPDVNYETQLVDLVEVKMEPKFEPFDFCPEPNNLDQELDLSEAKIIDDDKEYMVECSIMSEESVLNQIKSVCNEEDLITQYAYKDSNRYFATIRTKMEKEVEHSKWCDEWIKKFSSASASDWIVRYTFPSAKKYIYRKVFKCHHNSFNKVKERKRSNLRVRNKGCKATVNILIKKINPYTIKNDPHLKKKLNVVITVNFDHSHNVMVAESVSYLRMTLDTQKIFLKYFDDGITPAAAKTYHEMLLESQYDGPDCFMHLSNTQVNPTERQVNHLYNKWRTTNAGNRKEKSILELLRQKEETINNTGMKLFIKEDPLIVIVITPIMLRAHERNFAHDIVFIDSRGSCDQNNTCVTFLFAAAKIGAIPLACILHTEQSEANYTLVFSLLREKLGIDGFGGYGFPNIIITDDSLAQRNSLTRVFPEANLLLSRFHVSRAFWRWLWNSLNGIFKVHRKIIMTEFQRLLYSACEEDAEEIYQEFLKNKIHLLYDNLLTYIRNTWERRTEWLLCFKSQLVTGENNTSNFAETSIRIFKDVVLQRCRAFNACALVDFLVTVSESYHRMHLLAYANSRKNTFIDNLMIQTGKNISIDEIAKNTYRVSSNINQNLFYTAYTDISFCDCVHGQCGRFCKHLCAVQQKLGIVSKSAPTLTLEDKIDFTKIALGDDASTNFFESMDTDDVGQEPLQTIENGELKNSPKLTDISNSNNNLDDEAHSTAVAGLLQQFQRITNIAANCNLVDMTNTVIKLTKTLKCIETPASLVHFFRSIPSSKKRQISVQPTLISRRKILPGLTSGAKRVPAGISQKKRQRCLQANINLDEPRGPV